MRGGRFLLFFGLVSIVPLLLLDGETEREEGRVKDTA